MYTHYFILGWSCVHLQHEDYGWALATWRICGPCSNLPSAYNEHDQLVPIAIQLRQGIRKEDNTYPNPIFLPNDDTIDLTVAKVYYQAVHSQVYSY